MTVKVFQRDPPRKTHIVADQVNDSTVVTECGREFTQPAGAIITFTYDPSEPVHEQTYIPPVPEARCKRCPWDEVEGH